MAGPLSGKRVLELTTTVSGPMTAMILADQGADVIKVEAPPFGDQARYLGSIRGGMGAMFAVLHRNKRAVSLDLKEPRQHALFLSLVDTADVLVENYRPGATERLGVDYPTLAQRNPRLVYASISGYGPDGPYQNRRVYDPLIQDTVGASHAQGLDQPTHMRTIVFDKVASLTAAQAITAALLQRETTGRGQHLPISMLEAGLYYTWPDMMWSHTLLGDGVAHNGELADWFPVFEARDGFVSLVLGSEHLIELLSVWCGAKVHEDPRFSSLPAQLAHPDEFRAAVNELLADKTTDEICEAMDAFGVPASRVNRLEEVHEDPQVRHMGSLVERRHPVAGEMRFPRPPVRYDEQPADPDAFPERPAPTIGQHNREILSDVGAADELLDELASRDAENAEALRKAFASR